MTTTAARIVELEAAALAALRYHDRNTCTHESTHRGGIIWTICDDCGMRWADDQGGFVPYSDPPEIANLRALVAPVVKAKKSERSALEKRLAVVEAKLKVVLASADRKRRT